MLMRGFLLAILVGVVLADTYLHSPRGSNDRLNGNGRDRDNGNRLFDSQDNNRGGYNRGSTNGNEYYYEGTVLPVMWTVQHSCGHPNINCNMVLQYTCNAYIRDGTTETTIPDSTTVSMFDQTYGRHESYAWYQSCKARSRNMGLFISDRQLNGNGAIFTRQNNNGGRYGYECPEEREYYPYWHPSPWKDIAIMTDDLSRCADYQSKSQNVAPRFYCSPDANWQANQLANNQYGFIPITQLECEALTPPGVWTMVQPWGIPAPDCVSNTWTRDNHLGTPWYNFEDNLNSTTTSHYDWTIPSFETDPSIFQVDPLTGELNSEHCVFRLRYNMTSSEFDFMTTSGTSWPAGTYTQSGGYESQTAATGSLVDWQQNAPYPAQSSSRVDVWSQYRLTQSDVQNNLNDRYNQRTTTQRLTDYATMTNIRGYVLEGNNQNPWVDIFGSLVTNRIFHQLAVDTSQFGRTFQDRSHMFSIRQRPTQLQGAVIHNVAVRGGRGNNQQNYPRTEYEFTPERFTVNMGDMIHFQWNGANTNNQNNAGQGTAGTDRSNVITLCQKYQNKDPNTYSTTDNNDQSVGNFVSNYPSRIDAMSDSVNAPFLGYGYDDLRSLALYGIYNPYFDAGPRQVTRSGTWYYVSTRNNNFTNRSQKGKIIVNGGSASYTTVQWGAAYNKPYTASGDSWLIEDYYKFPISADVYLVGWPKDPYYDSEWAQLIPIRFSVTPGSYQMMAMKFQYIPFMTPNVYWSSSLQGQQLTSVHVSGIYNYDTVSFQVNAGGYYVVKNQPDPGMIAGVLVAVIVVCGGGGYAFYRYKKGFKKTSSTGADVPLNTSRGGTSENTTTTGVEI